MNLFFLTLLAANVFYHPMPDPSQRVCFHYLDDEAAKAGELRFAKNGGCIDTLFDADTVAFFQTPNYGADFRRGGSDGRIVMGFHNSAGGFTVLANERYMAIGQSGVFEMSVIVDPDLISRESFDEEPDVFGGSIWQ